MRQSSTSKRGTPLQGSLFSEVDALRTVVISRQQDFDTLFEGFTKMRAVSYVVASQLLHELFDKRGYQEIEVVVGADLIDPTVPPKKNRFGRMSEKREQRLLKNWPGTLRRVPFASLSLGGQFIQSYTS